MRLVAAAFILLGCGYTGMALSLKFGRRSRQLEELSGALGQMEFDIDLLGMPVSESLERLSCCGSGALCEMFSYISRRLRENRCADMGEIWERAIGRFRFELCLTDEDLQILSDFSKSLGSGNSEKEKNNLKLAQMRLETAKTQAQSEAKRNAKMYRGLGFLAGIFIVTILI